MRFLTIYTPEKAGPPAPDHMERMGRLIEESTKSGVLISTGGLLPMSKGGACIKRSGEKITVIDGPFTETKELVAGYAILEAKSREEVIEHVKRFLDVAGDGETEVRQLMP